MIKGTKENSQKACSQNDTSKTSLNSYNPLIAATKLKQVNCHIVMMQNRFKALHVQDQYNRYKTIDTENRINLHYSIHEKLKKDRQLLKKSLQKMNDCSDLRQKSQHLRTQIKNNLQEARKGLLQQKKERTLSIYEEYLQHTKKIKINEQQEMQSNRQTKLMIQFQQQQKRQSMSRHFEDRKLSIRMSKSIDSGNLNYEVDKKQQQLTRMMQYEQELLKKSSQSLQASQAMKNKLNQIYSAFSHKTSKTSRVLLPSIKSRTSTSKLTGHSEAVII